MPAALLIPLEHTAAPALFPCLAALLPLQTSNEEAMRFYGRYGFEVGETIPGYYKRLDPPDAVVLRKALQPGGGGGGGSSDPNGPPA